MQLRPRLISHQRASNKGVKSLNRCFSILNRALSWAITSSGNKFCLKKRSRLIKALNNRFYVKFVQLKIGLLTWCFLCLSVIAWGGGSSFESEKCSIVLLKKSNFLFILKNPIATNKAMFKFLYFCITFAKTLL